MSEKETPNPETTKRHLPDDDESDEESHKEHKSSEEEEEEAIRAEALDIVSKAKQVILKRQQWETNLIFTLVTEIRRAHGSRTKLEPVLVWDKLVLLASRDSTHPVSIVLEGDDPVKSFRLCETPGKAVTETVDLHYVVRAVGNLARM